MEKYNTRLFWITFGVVMKVIFGMLPVITFQGRLIFSFEDPDVSYSFSLARE
jgi:hypothetical protein